MTELPPCEFCGEPLVNGNQCYCERESNMRFLSKDVIKSPEFKAFADKFGIEYGPGTLKLTIKIHVNKFLRFKRETNAINSPEKDS